MRLHQPCFVEKKVQKCSPSIAIFASVKGAYKLIASFNCASLSKHCSFLNAMQINKEIFCVRQANLQHKHASKQNSQSLCVCVGGWGAVKMALFFSTVEIHPKVAIQFIFETRHIHSSSYDVHCCKKLMFKILQINSYKNDKLQNFAKWMNLYRFQEVVHFPQICPYRNMCSFSVSNKRRVARHCGIGTEYLYCITLALSLTLFPDKTC